MNDRMRRTVHVASLHMIGYGLSGHQHACIVRKFPCRRQKTASYGVVETLEMATCLW